MHILSLLLAGLFLATSVAAEDAPAPYLTQLLQQARQARLADAREWHLLLHYRANLFGGYTSEQDDPGFFLAPDGKTNPEVELDATLRQFFSPDLVGRSKQPAQCAFVARYAWLKERLNVDPSQLPPMPCERFERWIDEFHARSVTLVFPSAFMNNPASMFGHTFLRIDQEGQTAQTRLLAYTINFAADVPPDEGLAYPCLLYTSDAADERSSVDLGGRRIIKKKKRDKSSRTPHAYKDKSTGKIRKTRGYYRDAD